MDTHKLPEELENKRPSKVTGNGEGRMTKETKAKQLDAAQITDSKPVLPPKVRSGHK